MAGGEQETGIVYLIGAGPGDARLLTIKGFQKIKEADVVVYDRLVNPKIVAEAQPEAERVYVGKKSGYHSRKQEEINDILISRANEGKVVARLKGGDPYIFGRGGEETSALATAGVAFEVVPGVSSAHAVPAYAGIPVTMRGKSSSVAIVTGHQALDKQSAKIDWARIATGPDTLVFLMGLHNIASIASQLIKHGRSPETPVAVISQGTTAKQRTIVGELSDIAAKTRSKKLEPPGVIVVGDVVRFRERFSWFENLPLFGKTILITRPRHQAIHLAQALENLGAETVAIPTIRIIQPTDTGLLDEALNRLPDYDWALFTSVNAVDFFLKRLQEQGKDFRALGGLRIAAIGPATAQRLTETGIVCDLVPKDYRAEGLLEALAQGNAKGLRFLLPRAKVARELLPKKLAELGATVDVVPVYETIADEGVAQNINTLLQTREIDVIAFTSASTVKNFHALADSDAFLSSGAKIACIGPITAAAARKLNLSVSIEATEYTVPGLVNAIVADTGKSQGRG